jgi:hypothetical protein
MMRPMNRMPIARVSQFLAHHKVKSKQTPKNILAILDAKMLKPHMTRIAPIKEDPRYPAGRVHAWIPPLCTDIKRLVLSNEVK